MKNLPRLVSYAGLLSLLLTFNTFAQEILIGQVAPLRGVLGGAGCQSLF